MNKKYMRKFYVATIDEKPVSVMQSNNSGDNVNESNQSRMKRYKFIYIFDTSLFQTSIQHQHLITPVTLVLQILMEESKQFFYGQKRQTTLVSRKSICISKV